MKNSLIFIVLILLLCSTALAVTVDNTTVIQLTGKNVTITFPTQQEFSSIVVTANSVTLDTYTLTPTATTNTQVNLSVVQWTDGMVVIDVVGATNTLAWVFTPVPYTGDARTTVTYAGAEVESDSDGSFSTSVSTTSQQLRMSSPDEAVCIGNNTSALTTLIGFLALMVAIIALAAIIRFVTDAATGQVNINNIAENWKSYVWMLVSVAMLIGVGLIVLSQICW